MNLLNKKIVVRQVTLVALVDFIAFALCHLVADLGAHTLVGRNITISTYNTTSIDVKDVARTSDIHRRNRTAFSRSLWSGTDTDDSASVGERDSEDRLTEKLNHIDKGGIQRVARNAHKKMELIDSRVDQIQSLIDENHRLPQNDTQVGENSDSTGDTEDMSSSQDEFGRREKPIEATSSSTNIVNNIESPSTASDNWSAPLNELDQDNNMDSIHSSGQEDQKSSQGDESGTDSNKRHHPPTIQSVIPGRQSPVTSAPSRILSSSGGGGDNYSSQINSIRLDDKLDQMDRNKYPRYDQSSNFTITDMDNNNDQVMSANQSMGNNISNSSSHIEAPVALPSMMGAEWSPNQNYQYFSELNAKNHGHSGGSRESSSNFKPVIGSQLSRRFPNMTIVNSETDLVKSFSVHQLSPMTTTKRPPVDPLTPMTSVPRKSSVYTYSGSNYGKSSKSDRAKAQTKHEEAAESRDNYNGSQYANDEPVRWPSFATSFSTSSRPNNDNNIGLPPSGSSSNEYSSLMQPARNQESSIRKIDTEINSNSYNQIPAEDKDQTQERRQVLNRYSPQLSSGDQSEKSSYVTSAPNSQPVNQQNQASSSDLNHRSSSHSVEEQQPNYTNYDLSNSVTSDLSSLDSPASINSNHDFADQATGGYSGISQNSYAPTTRDKNYYALQDNGLDAGATNQLDSNPPQVYNLQTSLINQLSRQLNPIDVHGETPDSQLDRHPTGSQVTSSPSESPDTKYLLDPTKMFLYQAAASRSNQNYQGQDAMQLAATSNTNNLLKQQPSPTTQTTSNVDVNSLLQRYQQQQRILASQLQQQSDAQGANSNSISRAFYVNQPDPQPAAQTMIKRYSPDTLAAYLSRSIIQQQQPQMSSSELSRVSTAGVNNLMPYAISPSLYQSSSSLYPNQQLIVDPNTVKNANLAYYRAALATAAARNSAQQQYLDNQSSYYMQQTPTSSNPIIGGNNYSSGSMFATAAMNSPVFYDATGHQKGSDSSLGSQSGTSSYVSSELSNGQQRQQQMSSDPYRRSYLKNLFKPSSRYYYTPTLLSPVTFQPSSAALHSLYAPAMAASEPLTALPQVYATAATNPYATYTTAPTLGSPTPVDQVAQQYQAYAAAAASGLQPHYVDTEMAESSLVPSDTSYTSDTTSQVANSGAAAYSSGEDNSQSGSSISKSSKGMSPWTNIAGLLLGILPFGILMASLLPAVTVTGRKKRELEIGGRNFSDLLKLRPPSQVLNAIIGQPIDIAIANATSAINEQIESVKGKGARRSLSPVAGGFFRSRSSQQSEQSNLNSTSTLSSPIRLISTTPMPSLPPASQSANYNASGVKAKVKKALNVWNNLITAAQNIKRKHRSSIVDNQWTLPSFLKNSLKIENLFSLDEYKRQLANLVQARLLSASNQFIQDQSLISKSNEMIYPEKRNEKPRNNETTKQDMKEHKLLTPPNTSQFKKENATIPRIQMTSLPVTFEEENTKRDYVKNNNDYRPLEISRPIELTAPVNPSGTTLNLSHYVDNEQMKPTEQSFLRVSTEPIEIQNPLPKHNLQPNSTLRHLEVCLNRFLCRLTIKLNKSLSNSISTGENNKQSTMAADQVEKVLKKHINQLIQQIETEHPSVSLGSKNQNRTVNTIISSQANQNDLEEDKLDVLYRNAMENRCSDMYKCVELSQLEKTLAKMKLKFS